MKVASCISLVKVDELGFKLWLNSLPISLREGQKEVLWRKTRKKVTVVWTDKNGFMFY